MNTSNFKLNYNVLNIVILFTGLSIHTFHGNFFVRSTDLLSLPNVNPDAGYAVQMSVEESLTDMQVVCFQSALLYTSSKGKQPVASGIYFKVIPSMLLITQNGCY